MCQTFTNYTSTRDLPVLVVCGGVTDTMPHVESDNGVKSVQSNHYLSICASTVLINYPKGEYCDQLPHTSVNALLIIRFPSADQPSLSVLQAYAIDKCIVLRAHSYIYHASLPTSSLLQISLSLQRLQLRSLDQLFF